MYDNKDTYYVTVYDSVWCV